MFYPVVLFFVSILACLKAVLDYFERKRKRFQNLPTGPKGIPLFGNLLQLGRKPYLTLSKWAEEFGRFYTIDLLGTPAVVINTTQAMKDLLGRPEATGKYESIITDAVHGADYGIVNTEGDVWNEQHKYFVKVLRKFGFRGGNQLAPTIISECESLCNIIGTEMKQSESGILNIEEVLLHSVANIVWSAVTGERHSSNKNRIVNLLDELTKRINKTTVLIFMPWLRFIAPNKTGWNQLVKTGEEYHAHLEAYFEKRKEAKKLNRDNNPVNIIDAYIDQVENCQDTQSTFYGVKGMKHGLFAVGNLLLGGSETTSSIIKWLIHYLLAYPNVQNKLQVEVDQVVQKEGDNLAGFDRNRLPYLNAVIQEVLRITTLTPCGNIHRLLDDVTYEGFILRKGTFLLANIYFAHKNTVVWKDPQTFRPERFLEGLETEQKTARNNIVAFQEGRRKCPGEQAAQQIIFWYAFKLVQNFSFYKEERRCAEEYLEPVPGFLLLPPQLPVVVKGRQA